MDNIDKTGRKAKSRSVILFLMLLLTLIIAVWAFIQSVSSVNKEPQDAGTVVNKNTTSNGDGSRAGSQAGTGNGSGTSGSDSSQDNTAGEQVDMEQLAEDILSKVKFETELKQIDETVARGLIEISEDSEILLYMGNGNYSDELLLITSPDTENASTDMETAIQYFKDMRKSFEAYIPEQAKKISDAVAMGSGCYIAFCVTNDTGTAREIIHDAFE